MTEADIARKLTNVEALTGTFDMKLAEMRELHNAAEERRVREEVAAEERREKEAKRRKEHEASLLQMQVDEAEERAKRSKMQTKLLGFLVAAVTGGGGVGIWAAMQQPTDEQKAAEAKPVTETVTREADDIDERVDKVERKTEILKDLAQEQQIQIVDDGKYTRDLIRAAHPRAKDAFDEVDVPDSVPKAAAKAEAVKRAKQKAQEELFDEDAADPFAALDEKTEKP